METPKVNPGAIAQASALFQKFNALTTPPNIFQSPDQTGSQSSMFPASIGSTDPMDQRYMMQSQMVKDGVVPNIGMPIVGPEFFDYAKRKQDQALNFEFVQWVQKQADLTRPESAAWWFERFPWMKELRLGEIEREAEVQKRLAKIQVTGPQDSDDFMILFMQKQGLLKPAGVPLYQLNQSKAIQQNGFVAGIFNPLNTTYPQAMSGSIVPFDAPVNGTWTGPNVNNPLNPPFNTSTFNPSLLLGGNIPPGTPPPALTT